MRTLDYLGLDEKKVQRVVEGLSVLLADLQVFYSNLRGFHWNVTGPQFFILHAKYEELYNDIANKVDEVAERILQLGGVPESRYSVYLQVSEVGEEALSGDAREALLQLLNSYKTLIACERGIVEAASEAGDESTVALVSAFLKQQEKTVWMLVALSDSHAGK